MDPGLRDLQMFGFTLKLTEEEFIREFFSEFFFLSRFFADFLSLNVPTEVSLATGVKVTQTRLRVLSSNHGAYQSLGTGGLSRKTDSPRPIVSPLISV